MSSLLKISRGSQYALAAIARLALLGDGETRTSSEIAVEADIPKKFTANILSLLANHNLLLVKRGKHQGYSLARPASLISVLDVIEAYGGEFDKPYCFLDSHRLCNAEDPCALHETWQAMKESVRQTLANKSVADLAAEMRGRKR